MQVLLAQGTLRPDLIESASNVVSTNAQVWCLIIKWKYIVFGGGGGNHVILCCHHMSPPRSMFSVLFNDVILSHVFIRSLDVAHPQCPALYEILLLLLLLLLLLYHRRGSSGDQDPPQ